MILLAMIPLVIGILAPLSELDRTLSEFLDAMSSKDETLDALLAELQSGGKSPGVAGGGLAISSFSLSIVSRWSCSYLLGWS